MAKPQEANKIKSIINLRQENGELADTINFLTMDNFDYGLKSNRMKRIIANIDSITKTIPGKLLEISDDIYEIVQACSTATPARARTAVSPKNDSIKPLNLLNTKSPTKTQHIINPHMVNGQILYIPTINVTRLSKSLVKQSEPKSSVMSDADDSDNDESENTSDSKRISSTSARQASPVKRSRRNSETLGIDNRDLSATSTAAEFSTSNLNNEPSSSSTPSKSASHSTVLSGTFQEVKIYLTQISQDDLSDTSQDSDSETRNQFVTKRSRNSKRRQSSTKSAANSSKRIRPS